MTASRKEVDQVDRVARRDDANEIAGDGDVAGADYVADHVERAEHLALRFFDARTRRSA